MNFTIPIQIVQIFTVYLMIRKLWLLSHHYDDSFTIDEISQTINKLKKGKTAGADGLVPELYLRTCPQFA